MLGSDIMTVIYNTRKFTDHKSVSITTKALCICCKLISQGNLEHNYGVKSIRVSHTQSCQHIDINTDTLVYLDSGKNS